MQMREMTIYNVVLQIMRKVYQGMLNSMGLVRAVHSSITGCHIIVLIWSIHSANQPHAHQDMTNGYKTHVLSITDISDTMHVLSITDISDMMHVLSITDISDMMHVLSITDI